MLTRSAFPVSLLYRTLENSVAYLLLSTDAHQAITVVSVPYCTSENENLLLCIELCMPGVISSINQLRRDSVTILNTTRRKRTEPDLPYSQGMRYIEPGSVDLHRLQGVDRQEGACPSVAYINDLIRVSSHVFFSSLNSNHLIEQYIMNIYTGTQRQRTRSTYSEPPMTQSSPQKKERQCHYSRVPKRWLLSFPTRVILFVLFAGCLVPGFVACLPEDDV